MKGRSPVSFDGGGRADPGQVPFPVGFRAQDAPRWRSDRHSHPRAPAVRMFAMMRNETAETEAPVVDFSAPGEASRWRAVDDVVMGGRSSSRLEPTGAGTCVFVGRVSLDHGGGFASVRSSDLHGDLSGASAVAISCRGDGKTYKLNLRTRRAGETLAYQVAFTTVMGEWSQHSFEARDFTPVWRGRTVSGAPPLDITDVSSLGLLISNEQEGPFRLELRSIGKH